jgi:hypothetical protein
VDGYDAVQCARCLQNPCIRRGHRPCRVILDLSVACAANTVRSNLTSLRAVGVDVPGLAPDQAKEFILNGLNKVAREILDAQARELAENAATVSGGNLVF